MAIFGKKRKEENKLSTIEAILQQKPMEEVVHKPIQETRQESPVNHESTAPLFVKVEKYEKIFSSINELKSCLANMKNTFTVLNRLENLKKESLNVLQEAIENSERKLSFLNSELLKPSGYEEEIKIERYKVEDLEGILDELRSQVDHLKAELK
jgi:predicted RNase H-like nuclease (RuvC/YqgF family)